jgi:hypothetical protein
MKGFMTRPTALFLLAAFLITGSSCAVRPRLEVQGAEFAGVKGRYSLILYGCTYFDDLRTLAILDREGDPYTIEPYVPDFDYRVVKNLPAQEALKRAEIFASGCNSDFMLSRLSAILTKDGAVAGYELMPLYWAYTYGESDVLNTHYFLDKNKIIAFIKLKHKIKLTRESGFGSRGER